MVTRCCRFSDYSQRQESVQFRSRCSSQCMAKGTNYLPFLRPSKCGSFWKGNLVFSLTKDFDLALRGFVCLKQGFRGLGSPLLTSVRVFNLRWHRPIRSGSDAHLDMTVSVPCSARLRSHQTNSVAYFISASPFGYYNQSYSQDLTGKHEANVVPVHLPPEERLTSFGLTKPTAQF